MSWSFAWTCFWQLFVRPWGVSMMTLLRTRRSLQSCTCKGEVGWVVVATCWTRSFTAAGYGKPSNPVIVTFTTCRKFLFFLLLFLPPSCLIVSLFFEDMLHRVLKRDKFLAMACSWVPIFCLNGSCPCKWLNKILWTWFDKRTALDRKQCQRKIWFFASFKSFQNV